MVAFAVGGLLGDTLFHLLPEIFLGEVSPEHVRLVLVEPNRNLLLGVAIMAGFMTFVAMDKASRIAAGSGGGHDHSHSHGHGSHSHDAGANGQAQTTSSEVSSAEVRSRKKGKDVAGPPEQVDSEEETNPSVKLGGYLNLM